MGLFDRNMQTGANAQQLGFAPPAAPANSFTPPGLPVGYGQMQGQPLLSRNPNYGVPTGIAALLGGQNPMGAPQTGALLTPQQAAPNPMEGINPLTGQPFQTFDAGATTDAITQGRQAEEQRQRDMLIAAQERASAEQAATEAAAQAERDRIAAEQAAAAQAEQDRIATERAAAEAAAQAERDRIAAEAAAEAEAKAEADRLAAEEAARQEAARERAEAARERIEAASGNGRGRGGGFAFTDGMMDQFGGEGQMSGGPAFRPSTSMGGEKGGGIGQIMTGQPAATTTQPAPVRPTPTPRPVMDQSLGDRLRGMGGMFSNAIAPGDPGYEAALAEAGPGSGGLFSGAIPGLTPEQIENIKQAQEQRRASGQSGFLGKLGGTKTDPIADIGSMGGVGGMMGGIGGMTDPAVMERVRQRVAAVQPPPPVSTPKPAKSVGRSKGRRKPVPPKPNTETVKKKPKSSRYGGRSKAPTTKSRGRRRRSR
jgi:hypothetical protein